MKKSRINNTRFRWSRYFNYDKDKTPGIRLYCAGDGSGAKVTHCRYLSPEELIETAKWLRGVARDLKKLRKSGGTAECLGILDAILSGAIKELIKQTRENFWKVATTPRRTPPTNTIAK